mmetsp:Transcript_80553/g.232833  ORF Transcript_80553/g.232833 Transcript_80553/m.232833 type:complete len:537 (-) Transcript_80553:651-2261(-)
MEPRACDKQHTASVAFFGSMASSASSKSPSACVCGCVCRTCCCCCCCVAPFGPLASADCARRMDSFSIKPSMCFSFSTNCMMNCTRSSAPPLSCPLLSWWSGKIEMIWGSRLYTTFVLLLDNSWNKIRATRAVGSCTQAVSHKARTSKTALGLSMSFSTKCVRTNNAVSRSSATAPPSAPGVLPSEAYNLPVHGSTTFGCRKRRSPTATSSACRNVVSSINDIVLAPPIVDSGSSPASADNAPLEPPLGKRIENKSCKLSWQNFFDTVIYLQRLIAPSRRKMGSVRKAGSSRHANNNGLILSRRLREPKTMPDSASSKNASFSRSSWPTPPMLVAWSTSSSSSLSSLPPFFPFFGFLFFSRCSAMRASSSASLLRFKADCNVSRYTSILNAKCPAKNTAQPNCWPLTLNGSADPAGTMSPAPAASASPSASVAGASAADPSAAPTPGSSPEASPSQIGAAASDAGAVRTAQSIRFSTRSHNLSGHRCATVLALVAMEISKDKSIAACAAPNHWAGTSPRAKQLTTTKIACSVSAHM